MIEIIDCEQRSEAWFAARLGIASASEFHTLLAIKKDARDKKTRTAYLHKLAGEIITQEPAENYSNAQMERGRVMEEEARDFYAFQHNEETKQVGFIRNGAKGCSPDLLVGKDGMAEFKSNSPHVLIDRLLRDEFPPEHKAQCQGGLWVAEREWIDIGCYWNKKLPMFLKRAYRDEIYIADLSKAVDQFNDELAAIVEKIRRYGQPQEKAA